MNELTHGARRRVAERAALDQLVRAGDPVALALTAGIAEAQRVELTGQLIERVAQRVKKSGVTITLADLSFVMNESFEAAGFEVIL